MSTKVSDNDLSHNDSIVSQFTKQAIPFAQMSQHSNRYGLELMLKLSDPKQDDMVLDIACGTGIVSGEFARIVSHVTGIDLTPAMIEQARLLQQEKQLENINWKIGDVSNLPFNDNLFSMVVTRYSFHHLLNPKKVLEEMKRVCMPGGKILVIDVTPDVDKVDAYNYVEKLRDSSHTRAFTFSELENLIKEVGLVNLKSEYHNLEMQLEKILQSSFPNPKDVDKIKQLYKEDLTKNNLGMKSHLRNGEVYFYFPVSMIVGNKM
ncbi:MAG: methyltransferase domain-containing protein [Thermoproteota archaeon]|nr:methyltransferase domain-containing protein [Thermoproteota archaeon]